MDREIKGEREDGDGGGERFKSDKPFDSGSDSNYLSLVAASVYFAVTVVLTLPVHFRKLSRYLKEK